MMTNLTGKSTERDIQNCILDWLWMKKIFCWHQKTTGTYDTARKKWRTLKRYSIRGVSDILGVIGPQGFFLQLRSKPQRPKNNGFGIQPGDLGQHQGLKRLGNMRLSKNSFWTMSAPVVV